MIVYHFYRSTLNEFPHYWLVFCRGRLQLPYKVSLGRFLHTTSILLYVGHGWNASMHMTLFDIASAWCTISLRLPGAKPQYYTRHYYKQQQYSIKLQMPYKIHIFID